MGTTTVAVPDSDGSEDELNQTPKRDSTERDPSQSQSVLSHRFRDSSQKVTDRPSDNRARKSGSVDSQIAVILPAPSRPWEFKKYQGDTTVDSVLEELYESDGETKYKIEYEDGRKAIISLDKLLKIRNGRNALDLFNNNTHMKSSTSQDDSEEPDLATNTRSKRARGKTHQPGFVDTSKMQLDSDDEDDQQGAKKRRIEKGTVSRLARNATRQSSRVNSNRSSRHTSHGNQDDDDDESDDGVNVAVVTRRRGALTTRESKGTRASGRVTRSAMPKEQDDEEDDELARDIQETSDNSDIIFAASEKPKTRATRTKAKTASLNPLKTKRSSRRDFIADESTESEKPEQPTRKSGRERVRKNMREQDMEEEQFADDVAKVNVPKVISIREVYQQLAKNSPFKLYHSNQCDTCRIDGNSVSKGPLIHCQGCSTSIHKNCLGYRSARKHMVTKIGHEDFVMQCRRCIGVTNKYDASAPPLNKCQTCHKPGLGCKAFSAKKTSKEEEKIREANGGDDPITEVSADKINNADNLLFRCVGCQRGYHFEHLPDPNRNKKKGKSKDEDPDAVREARRKEYKDWNCSDCLEYTTKITGLVAWRPTSREGYTPERKIDNYTEGEKEYLVKWEGKSYLHCIWMPGSWVWGVTASVMRKAFAARDEGANETPKWTKEEAIPEEFVRMEIIFDVEYSGDFSPKSEKADKAKIHQVEQVLVKFRGLGYEEAVWEDPPNKEEEERWNCFVAAYNEYVVGVYYTRPPPSVMKKSVELFRSRKFDVDDQKQPASLVGGDLMPYQKDGMNWMLYKYHQQKNVILADEMGLGKTIQVIGLLASLVKENAKCSPFLIVTPNSTCPNWRREIKKWAPSLRVVTFYGGRAAREMAMKYELYPDGCSDLRADVVVTSYEAPVDDSSRSFFRRISWAGMIVDEGQRLKNDANLLYSALTALKTPFQVLLTGTPLQNNKRELFNLLAFLDPTQIDAAKLETKYEILTKDTISDLQNLIRPYFLRRTKAQVLKDLPSLSQMILPVSMSVVQKKLYKIIIAKNAELMKSIFGQDTAHLRPKEKGNLNNILMQLRKCLCHPFTYSPAIEETGLSQEATHRNLIDASSKFQLLEIMLPKLKERGHRVLLFSQFLNQLDLVEDFLRGLDLSYRRLDGTMSAQEKQKRIDEFNAPDSSVFAFLLSTRSGGVGINLATADTVIIMDPDFNPQQDIQAISRAHRIGQKNKVLVFQLVTKDSAEEKIMQIGRKKIALGALIETMGAEDDDPVDVESILKHGTKALFEEDDGNDIRHDEASVDKLLDRAQVDEVNTDQAANASSTFSLARVWAQDKGTLEEDLGDNDAEDDAPNPSVWDSILKEREAQAALEAAKNVQDFGRGKRVRNAPIYGGDKHGADDDDAPRRRRSQVDHSDPEFGVNADAAESDPDDFSGDDMIDPRELEAGTKSKGTKESVKARRSPSKPTTAKSPRKVKVPPVSKGVKRSQVPFKPSMPESDAPLAQSAAGGRIVNKSNKRRKLQSSSTSSLQRSSIPSPSEVPVPPGLARPIPQSGSTSSLRQNSFLTPSAVSSSLGRPVPPLLVDASTTGLLPESTKLTKTGKFRIPVPPTNIHPPPPRPLPSNVPYVPSNGAPPQGGYRFDDPRARGYVPQNQPNPLNQFPSNQPQRAYGPTPILPPTQYQGGYMRPAPSFLPPASHTPVPQIVDRFGNAIPVRAGQSISVPRPGAQPCYTCGLRHIGITPSCPTFSSSIEIRLMLDALVTNRPPHPAEFVGKARTYLEKELKRNTALRLSQRQSN
ncbi:hypothetical protein HYFRA_00003330 [Hymenoscyphus fraxineus]|uniref:Chromatin remodeling factor mit1 n=1 Tax=Hymenoscyphus fraxineus TaxID=746836 RepID=A0A9N9KW93_9HELO|nr:hypothetical protein HYFRA_00003330 [Hymenoscyphus fraxineus]